MIYTAFPALLLDTGVQKPIDYIIVFYSGKII